MIETLSFNQMVKRRRRKGRLSSFLLGAVSTLVLVAGAEWLLGESCPVLEITGAQELAIAEHRLALVIDGGDYIPLFQPPQKLPPIPKRKPQQ